jgi:CRP-like cAMP-binding protein
MALEDDIALLSQVSLFQDMDRDVLRLIAFAAETRQLRAGDTLFRKNEVSDSGFVVAQGSIALIDGDANNVVGIAGPGTLLGELALVAETRRPATAVVREHATVLRLSRAMFRRTLDEYPQFAQRLYADLRARVEGLSSELIQVKDALRRIDQTKQG